MKLKDIDTILKLKKIRATLSSDSGISINTAHGYLQDSLGQASDNFWQGVRKLMKEEKEAVEAEMKNLGVEL